MRFQLLDNYKDNIVVYPSEHYIFSVPKGSLAEHDVESIISKQEQCYQGFQEAFKVKSQLTIHYYLFNSSIECGKQYRHLYPEEYSSSEPDEAVNGYTYYPDKIFATYNDTVKCMGYHEDVHILMDEQYGDICSCFVKEGIAMAFDKVWWGIDNKYWAKVIIQKGLLKNLVPMFDNEEFFKYDERLTYPVAGTFTEWLLVHIGLEEYKKYYKSFIIKESFPSITFREAIVEGFIKSINDIEIDKETEDTIEKSIKKTLKE